MGICKMIYRRLNNEQGYALLIALIFLAVFTTGIVGFFYIKSYEIDIMKDQKQKNRNELVAEQVIRKYLYLTQNAHKGNWRLGVIMESYRCSDNSTCECPENDNTCLNQTWTLIEDNAPPFRIRYITGDDPLDSDAYHDLPKEITYDMTDPDGKLILIPSDLFSCLGFLIENVPVNKTFANIRIIEKPTEVPEEKELDMRVFVSRTPVI